MKLSNLRDDDVVGDGRKASGGNITETWIFHTFVYGLPILAG